MYNSSLKGKDSVFEQHLAKRQIPDKVFFNDMSQVYMQDAFKSCDVVYSEPAWNYGYKGFNEKAGNSPDSWKKYMENINLCVCELDVPSFIIGGKQAKRYFPGAKMQPCRLIANDGTVISEAFVFVWNYDLPESVIDTKMLIDRISKEFGKCLDFSCGYGEHLFNFRDFVACDVNMDCLAWIIKRLEEDKG